MIDWAYSTFVDPLTQTFFQKALLGGSVVALVCGVVGCLVVLRRMAFLGDALSHAMIAGVAGGYLFMRLVFGEGAHAPAMLIGSVLAAIITVGLIGFVSRVSRIKEDTAIGIMYCGVFAAGVVLVSIFRHYIHIDLMHFIMGDVLGVADADLWVAVLVAAFVLSVILLFFRHFQITSFDPVMAASIGLPVVFIDYLLTTCVSLVVVSGVTMVGVILVVALLITPAATAYMLSDRLDRMMILAGIFGVTSVTGGLYLSLWIDAAGGGAIVLFATFQFVAVLILAPRYGLLAGWRRRRRIVPQQLVEDILGSIHRNAAGRETRAELARWVSVPSRQLDHAVATLVSDGLLVADSGALALTDSGTAEAERIRRAHRIWETYLMHMGLPKEKLHERAHVLEHISDRDSVEYLAHSLGHPVADPHGAPIEIRAAQAANGDLLLSALQPGETAEVIAIDAAPGLAPPFSPGDTLTLDDRGEAGQHWHVRDEAGNLHTLDHHAADAVRVQVKR